FDAPVISVNRAAELLGVGYSSAKKNIDRLVKTGIVWEISGAARNRLYLAGEIIEAVEGKPLTADLRPGQIPKNQGAK
ncbi:MAG TPA: hypothetical protein VHY37_10680, partial [Tepidisphaeraceae bacterium]|nr:hypothetical protein [Tepidisphaeraceae bacterium]